MKPSVGAIHELSLPMVLAITDLLNHTYIQQRQNLYSIYLTQQSTCRSICQERSTAHTDRECYNPVEILVEYMGKREKLIERLTDRPETATFADICNLLKYEAFHLDRSTESHHIFKYADLTFVVPSSDRQVKSLYLARVLELIEQSDSYLEADD